MKVALRPATVEWIKAKVFPYMDFKEACALGNLMHDIVRGKSCVYIGKKFLSSIVRICINNDMTDSAVFFALCAKMHKFNLASADKKAKKFCVFFDYTPGLKIPSIKAMRELIRSDAFIAIERGWVYDGGLKAVKDAVEAGIVLGPYNKKQIETIKVLLDGTPYTVDNYIGQVNLKEFQNKC